MAAASQARIERLQRSQVEIMKKPASFQIATSVTAPSAVDGLPSQLCEGRPSAPVICSSRPYCGV